MQPITPSTLSKDLVALCNDLVAGGAPVVLPVTPLENARLCESFEAVERQIAKHGGTACYGWALWELPGLFLEAEFYAAWRHPDGRLHDITLKPGPIKYVLFLPDPTRIFDGRRVNGVRRAISRDPAVTEFLRLCDEEFALVNRGARAFMRNVALQGAELGELQQIWQRKLDFSRRLLRLVNT